MIVTGPNSLPPIDPNKTIAQQIYGSQISSNSISASQIRVTPPQGVLSTRIEDYDILVAALIKMFGGAVIISEKEIEDARNLILTAERNIDFRTLVIRVEEKE